MIAACLLFFMSVPTTEAIESVSSSHELMLVFNSRPPKPVVSVPKTVSEVVYQDATTKLLNSVEKSSATRVKQIAQNVRRKIGNRVSRGGKYSRIRYIRGTKIEIKSSRIVKVLASAYSPQDKGVGKYTFSEVAVQKNIIAVDPRIIPIGSIVYVPGYGLAVAADIGSAIKGNRIDLFMETRKKALKWGKKYLNITVYS